MVNFTILLKKRLCIVHVCRQLTVIFLVVTAAFDLGNLEGGGQS